MTLAPWRSSLARALHRNRSRPYSRYLQLATLRSNGRPANRTVVFRGFMQDSNTLTLITDARSEKVGHIAHQPWAEACWYFTETREQYRLTGTLLLINASYPDAVLQTARQQTWESLSEAARAQFTWPASGQTRDSQSAFEAPAPHPSIPLESFCLLLLLPVEVDHLELRGDPQTRTHYRFVEPEQWVVESINP
ncbi:Npun_F5749 family FMN-dependent PPOX-type flavoprotein [Pseudanabaena sp. FACHB-2040]|uniref:Npun_F5749 family FMN-dependent PPOX-type flavoprotein n=1 Tax=Pseudanabaena sp. FACHB-2040 TaxID=2692859 RepID=UPI0016881926|nr:Npun_F5749 family FMN-dependent PPOX-type flavoprotein [Pseudanabaena sp. FACHB-2040]MBD2256391.1 pyridoxamine 5'-phosphate oxidase family protein [Pseudanabaena sp. FACHB-2040]